MKFWRWFSASFAVFAFSFFYFLLFYIIESIAAASLDSSTLLNTIRLFVGIGADPLFRMWADATTYLSLPLFAPLFVLFFMLLCKGMSYEGIKRGLVFGFFCWLVFSFPTLFRRWGDFSILTPIIRMFLTIITYLAVSVVASAVIGKSSLRIEKKTETNIVRWLVAGLIAGIAHYLFFNVSNIVSCDLRYAFYPYCLPLIGSLIFGLLFALFFMMFYNGLPGKGIIKGLFLGAFSWLVFVSPGLFADIVRPPSSIPFGFFGNVIGLMLITLLVHSLEGIIIAFVFGRSLEVKKIEESA